MSYLFLREVSVFLFSWILVPGFRVVCFTPTLVVLPMGGILVFCVDLSLDGLFGGDSGRSGDLFQVFALPGSC